MISKLLSNRSSRESYIRAKLNVLIPSQIKALRLNRQWTQTQLGEESEMKQARISAMEKPGEVAFTLETLIRLASAFRVGLQVKFVPHSVMVKWENDHSQDAFNAIPIEDDKAFINPTTANLAIDIVPTGLFWTPTTGLITSPLNKIQPTKFLASTPSSVDQSKVAA
jgi:transcriptional regulator with XRE-family HTH domain